MSGNGIIKFVTLLTIVALTPTTQAGVDAALSIEDGRISSFYLAIGDHYRVPEDQLIVVKKRQIPDEELAVVFYLSTRAAVPAATIIDLRLGGMTWMEITMHFHLTAEIYYVAIEHASGPPYGKAHGYFRNRNRDEWKTIRLADVDIVNFVNLRFISDHYGLSPDDVVRMREQGQSFIAIHDKVKQNKGKKDAADKNEKKTDSKSTEKGKKKK